MSIRWLTAFLDTPRNDAAAAVEFWRQITKSTLSEKRGSTGEFATLLPETGDAYLRTQDVDEGHVGCHLDVHVDDLREHLARAVESGATVVKDLGTLVVLRSPAGLEFCLVTHRGEQTRPAPVRCPDGRTSLVDQVCVDLRTDLFDEEVRFWAALTGWERRSGALAEFEFLDRPDGMPLRVMFQRLEAADPARPVGVHLDLASDDHEAEASAHMLLGATVVRRARYWTTLRDPAGRDYCITRRDPSTGRLR